MENKNYIVHSWDAVAASFERQIREYNPRYFQRHPEDNYLKDIYNDNLPRAIKDLFAQYYILNVDRNHPDIKILIDACKQLNDVGYIGRHR